MAGGSCLAGLGCGEGTGLIPAWKVDGELTWLVSSWKGVGLNVGDPGPVGLPVVFFCFFSLFASCSSLVLKSVSGLLFLISSDCSSLKGFLGVEYAGSSRAFALVVGSGILLLRS